MLHGSFVSSYEISFVSRFNIKDTLLYPSVQLSRSTRFCSRLPPLQLVYGLYLAFGIQDSSLFIHYSRFIQLFILFSHILRWIRVILLYGMIPCYILFEIRNSCVFTGGVCPNVYVYCSCAFSYR